VRERLYPIDVTARPMKVDPHVAAIGPAQVSKRLSERRDVSLRHGIGRGPQPTTSPHGECVVGVTAKSPSPLAHCQCLEGSPAAILDGERSQGAVVNRHGVVV
jgi:hypothetical protein